MVAGCMEQPRQHRTGCTPGDVVEALVDQCQHEPHGHDRPAYDKAALHDEHPLRLLELYGHEDPRFRSCSVFRNASAFLVRGVLALGCLARSSCLAPRRPQEQTQRKPAVLKHDPYESTTRATAVELPGRLVLSTHDR